MSKFLPVRGVHGDVAECCRAVILDVHIWGRQKLDKNWYRSSVDKLLPIIVCSLLVVRMSCNVVASPEWVMFSSAPVALRCTLMSFDFANLVRGPSAPDLAIFALLSSCVARLVMHPTALHCTSTFGDIIWRIKGCRPPSWTMETLFSAGRVSRWYVE